MSVQRASVQRAGQRFAWSLRLAAALMALVLADRPLQVQAAQSLQTQIREAQRLAAAGMHAEAETILAEVVDKNPKAGVAWMSLGYARHAQNKLDLALVAHLKAAEFPPLKATALYNAACVYSLQKDADRAIETLRQAIAAGFADRELLAQDADLTNVRADARFATLLPPFLQGNDLFAEPTRLIHTLIGEGPNHEFGWVARRVGDLDGDGAIDFVATAPGFGGHAGKIYVYSSRRGELLFARAGKPGQRLGNGAAGAGDVNADGTPDVIVGGPMAGAGVALILSGKDGSELRAFQGEQAGGKFGLEVCGLGDLNGDGHADVAVTAIAADGEQPGSGRCFGYSGKDGALLFTLDGERTGDKFGSALAGNGSAEHPMLIVGAQDAGPENRGRIYVYRFKDGVPERVFAVDAEPNGKELGQGFASFPGDLNGDGAPDVYASDFSDSTRFVGAGRVFVYSGVDGQLLLDLSGTQPGEGFGTSASDAGDVNGDGIGDLVVGAWQNREKGPSAGKVYLHSGADGALLASWTCQQSGDTFGFDATGLGDVDGDGRVDFLLTSAWSSVRGPKTGRVFIVAGSDFSDPR